MIVRFLITPILLAICAPVSAAPSDGLQLKSIVEYETKAKSGWYTDSWATSITSDSDTVFFVYVDAKKNPRVGRIDKSIVTDRSIEAGYTCDEDGHNEFSLAIDNDGYIHVAGNMHNNEFRYWVSEKPREITSFKRRFNAIPGSFSYYSFTRNPKGELFLMARIQTRNARQLSHGARGVGLFSYSTQNRKWTSLGSPAPTHDSKYPVIFWNPNGRSGLKGYQMFKADMIFDRNGRLHFTAQCSEKSASDCDNHVVYAYSDDDGRSFHRADGGRITLPMNITENASRPDVLEGSRETKLAERSGLLIDSRNRPGVFYFTDNALWLRFWSGSKWEPRRKLMKSSAERAVGLSDSKGIMSVSMRGSILRMRDFEANPIMLKLDPEIIHWDRSAKDLHRQLRGIEWDSSTGSWKIHCIRPS